MITRTTPPRRGRTTLAQLSLVTLAALATTALGCGEPSDPHAPGVATAIDDGDPTATTASALQVSGGKARWHYSAPFQDAAKLVDTLANLQASNTVVTTMTATPSGVWVVATGTSFAFGGSPPAAMVLALGSMLAGHETILAVALNDAGGWVAISDERQLSGGALPAGLADKLQQYSDNGWSVRDVDVTNTGWVILGSGTTASYSGVPAAMASALADRLASKRRVDQVALGPDGAWVVVAGQEAAYGGVSGQIKSTLQSAARSESHISTLMLGPSGGFALYSNGKAQATPGSVMEAIEYGTPGGQNLWERMATAGVPGVSIAVIEDNKVTAARGYGLLKQGEDAHVLATTPFDMASLSKYVGALTTLAVDADPTYDFDIDRSVVNFRRPNRAIDNWLDIGGESPDVYGLPHTDIATNLSVANFLRHESDFVQSNGSPPFAYGSSVLPNLSTLALMLGYDCSGSCGYNGAKFAWSTGGAGPVAANYDSVNFLVPQAVVEDVTQKKAHQLMQEYLFDPMGLNNISGSTSATLLSRAAWQHDVNGPRPTRAVYPWTFAGGVYAAPMDYAELVILALNMGRDSKGVQRVPAASIQELLRVNSGRYGFGIKGTSSVSPTESNGLAFLHTGRHGGRARTVMCGNPTRNEGIVVTLNADIGDDSDSDTVSESGELLNYVLDAFTTMKGWTGKCR